MSHTVFAVSHSQCEMREDDTGELSEIRGPEPRERGVAGPTRVSSVCTLGTAKLVDPSRCSYSLHSAQATRVPSS